MTEEGQRTSGGRPQRQRLGSQGGSSNASYGAAGHLAERVLAFLHERVIAPDGQAS